MIIDTRKAPRLDSQEWDDFSLKIFSLQGQPEYLIAEIRNISELGVCGFIDAGAPLAEKAPIAGIIESDLTRSKIQYTGKIVWLKETEAGIEFGIKFAEEMLLPDVFIARSIASV